MKEDHSTLLNKYMVHFCSWHVFKSIELVFEDTPYNKLLIESYSNMEHDSYRNKIFKIYGYSHL